MAATQGTVRFQQAYPHYERKIATYSRRNFQSIPGMEQPDLEIELQEVLWLACQKYDPNRGATFNTCFWEFVKNRVIDLKKSAFRQKRLANLNTVSLDEGALRILVYGDPSDEPDGSRGEGSSYWWSQSHSSEDEALARITVQERLRSGAKIR